MYYNVKLENSRTTKRLSLQSVNFFGILPIFAGCIFFKEVINTDYKEQITLLLIVMFFCLCCLMIMAFGVHLLFGRIVFIVKAGVLEIISGSILKKRVRIRTTSAKHLHLDVREYYLRGGNFTDYSIYLIMEKGPRHELVKISEKREIAMAVLHFLEEATELRSNLK